MGETRLFAWIFASVEMNRAYLFRRRVDNATRKIRYAPLATRLFGDMFRTRSIFTRAATF